MVGLVLKRSGTVSKNDSKMPWKLWLSLVAEVGLTGSEDEQQPERTALKHFFIYSLD